MYIPKVRIDKPICLTNRVRVEYGFDSILEGTLIESNDKYMIIKDDSGKTHKVSME